MKHVAQNLSEHFKWLQLKIQITYDLFKNTKFIDFLSLLSSLQFICFGLQHELIIVLP